MPVPFPPELHLLQEGPPSCCAMLCFVLRICRTVRRLQDFPLVALLERALLQMNTGPVATAQAPRRWSCSTPSKWSSCVDSSSRCRALLTITSCSYHVSGRPSAERGLAAANSCSAGTRRRCLWSTNTCGDSRATRQRSLCTTAAACRRRAGKRDCLTFGAQFARLSHLRMPASQYHCIKLTSRTGSNGVVQPMPHNPH